jgi:hypothetical protein
MAMPEAYQGYRTFSAEFNLQNFLCKPTVVAMPTDTLPLTAPLRSRPAGGPGRRLRAFGAAADLACRSDSRPRLPPSPATPCSARPNPAQPSPWHAAVSPVALRRAQLAALAVGGFLLPWCVVLSVTLPATAQAQHWPAAWVGLDAGEAIAALATAVLLARRDARAGLTAAAGGALLLTDAWFDVCTSGPGLDHAVALAEAAFIELPLAGAAFWLAVKLTRDRATR